MKKIKILYLDQGDFIGGAELFSLDVLSHLDKTRFEVVVATSGNKVFDNMIHKLKIKTRKTSFPSASVFHVLKFALAVLELRRLVKKEKPDIIHSNSVRGHLLSAMAKTFIYNTPFNPSEAGKSNLQPPKSNIQLVWMMHDFTFTSPFPFLTCWKPKAIIANSECVRTSLRKRIVYPKKIEIIRNGVDFGELNKIKKADLIKEFGLQKDVKTIGMVGRIVWWKGQKTFVEAAKIVNLAEPNTMFFIIGNSQSKKFEKGLKAWVKKNHMEKKIIFTGFRKDVKELIKGLDVLVHASTKPEPFGRTIVEGMALKTAVIASNIGGPKEIIENGKDGLLITTKNPVVLATTELGVLKNPKLKKSMEEAGYISVRKKYDLEKWVKEIEKVWVNLK